MKNIILKNVIVSLEEILNERGDFNGVNIKFLPVSQNQIYTTSEGEVVRDFPETLYKKGFDMDIKSLVDFTMALNANISTVMYSYRKDMPNGGELDYVSKSSLEEDMFLKINVTKHFFRNKNLGRDKVTLSIFEDDEDFGKNELISFAFSKKDIQVLFNLIIEISSASINSKPFFIPIMRVDTETGEEIRETTAAFLKVANSIVIDNIWLHGQEILNLMYTIDQLNYGFELEKNLNELNSFYRQVRYVNEDGLINMYIKKMKSNSEEEDLIDMQTGKKYHLRLTISSYVLTLFSMFVSIKMLQHGEFDYEEEIDTVYDSQKKIHGMKNIKYHISTKESFIGIGYNNSKKRGEEMIFASVAKDNAFNLENENGEVMELMYEKEGEKFVVLEEVYVSLRDQWPKFLEALSMAYTRSYNDWEKTSFTKKFFVTQNEKGKWYKYEFSISSSLENKAAAVLIVNKYIINGKNDYELISSFRQPLFKRYLFQLLVMFLNISTYFEKTEFKLNVNKKDIMKYRFQSMKKMSILSKNEDILYGFEREGKEFKWGIFSDHNHMKEQITDQDIKLLNISSLFRLIRGDWLPFVGQKICIGPDRYLTDIYGEFFLEKHFGDGELWASNIFFATSFGENL